MTMSTTAKYTTAAALHVALGELALRSESSAVKAAGFIGHIGLLVWEYQTLGLGPTVLLQLGGLAYYAARGGWAKAKAAHEARTAGTAPSQPTVPA